MEKAPVRLVTRLPDAPADGEMLILCPFLAGLDPAIAMWLGPLAWHDCNAALLAALPASVPSGACVFAGVFCADPFRSAGDLLGALHAAGVAGVANLPSVSFLDGEFAQTLDALQLGRQRELAFLRGAAQAGFRIAGCAGSPAEAQELAAAGAELLIVHAGPPLPEAHRDAGERLTRRLQNKHIRAVALSDLLETAAGRPGTGSAAIRDRT
ncbi:MAG TPA: phosphoenolpyruvate hydrolase family protein [Acetobacteraceae bacterium]|nr:phosphoenolpyruvate hydrolase family protein [Acetobacteraceae bacterium]